MHIDTLKILTIVNKTIIGKQNRTYENMVDPAGFEPATFAL
jgi:hypothetical protein